VAVIEQANGEGDWENTMRRLYRWQRALREMLLEAETASLGTWCITSGFDDAFSSLTGQTDPMTDDAGIRFTLLLREAKTS
jgi:hypothetical protein